MRKDETQSVLSPHDRQIRVFVSSTFSDMQEDRDYLVKFVFPQLRKLCEERAVQWTEVDLRWGITDEQIGERKVLPLCLEEIDRCRPYFIGLLAERYGYIPDSLPAELLQAQHWLKQYPGSSITELEVLHGVLRDQHINDHAYFYFRDEAFAKRIVAEERQRFVAEDPQSGERLRQLKDKIRTAQNNKLCKLREGYTNPEQLGEWILEDFTALVDSQYPKVDVPDALAQEAIRHEAYARSRRLAFVGRENLLDYLDEYNSTASKPLVLVGEAGCGKSALLAEWIARWWSKHPDDLIVQHYIGSTPDSANWQRLLYRLLDELRRAFSIDGDIPVDPVALRTALSEWASKTEPSTRVVLVLDALNQLSNEDAAQQFGWLPVVFPNNFRLVVSTLPGESFDVLQRRGWSQLQVPVFTVADIEPATRAYFKLFGKTPPQDILAKLEATTIACNPLYLRVVLDELRQFGKHDELEVRANEYLSAPDLPELFDKIINRWDEDFGSNAQHPDLVRESLCLIACARFGLSEAELLDLLGEKNRQDENEPLPRRLWTPFYLAAENALALRNGLINFGHEYLRAAVERRYLPSRSLARKYHFDIAQYLFSYDKSSWTSQPLDSPIVGRVLDEVPWQLVEIEGWEILRTLLSELPLLKAAYERAPLDVRRYWVQLEKRSQFRLTETYRHVFESPKEYRPYLRTLAALLTATGNVLEASQLHNVDLEMLRKEARPGALADAMLDLAANFFELGQLQKALTILKEAEEIGRGLDSEQLLGQIFGEQALVYQRLGKLDLALGLLTKQEEITRRAGATRALASCLANQTSIHLQNGDLHCALALARQVEELRKETGDLHGLADCLNSQAIVHHALNQLPEARSLLTQQRKLCRLIGHRAGLADGLSASAEVELASGKAQRAKKYLTIAGTLNSSLERRFNLAGNLQQLGRIFQHEGRDEDAIDAFEQALTYFEEAQDGRRVAIVGLRHAGLLITQKRHQEALSSLDRALVLNPTLNELNAQLQVSRAEVLNYLGQHEAALEALDQIPLHSLSEVKGVRGPLYSIRAIALRELRRTDDSLIAIQQAEDALEADGQRGLLVTAMILHAQILIFDLANTAGVAELLERARAIATEEKLSAGLTNIKLLLDRVKEKDNGL